jgi:hypothetical protein
MAHIVAASFQHPVPQRCTFLAGRSSVGVCRGNIAAVNVRSDASGAYRLGMRNMHSLCCQAVTLGHFLKLLVGELRVNRCLATLDSANAAGVVPYKYTPQQKWDLA